MSCLRYHCLAFVRIKTFPDRISKIQDSKFIPPLLRLMLLETLTLKLGGSTHPTNSDLPLPSLLFFFICFSNTPTFYNLPAVLKSSRAMAVRLLMVFSPSRTQTRGS